jgi:fructose-1,6-bisphosphatase/inositol monophosphatase family enzyme
VTSSELLALFDVAFDAQRRALAALDEPARRARADGHAGQYALDVVADEAILDVLLAAGVAVLSEESGRSGPPDASVTVIVDPVDGSTNCARGIPYWGISLCAVDADGPWCSLVANGATGSRNTAVRNEGSWRDGEPLTAAATTRIADSVIGVAQLPPRHWGWKQFRALGSVALGLCDLASGGLDAWVELAPAVAPWDYLGGMLVAREAGAQVVDADGRDLVTTDPDIRCQLFAAATPELLAEIRAVAMP